jgi:protease I
MIDFVRDMDKAGKLVSAICHGGWVLASAGVCKGRKITGYSPIQDDVVNAGGTWVSDMAAVVDGNVITARTPPDLPAFAAAIVAYLGQEAAARKVA